MDKLLSVASMSTLPSESKEVSISKIQDNRFAGDYYEFSNGKCENRWKFVLDKYKQCLLSSKGYPDTNEVLASGFTAGFYKSYNERKFGVTCSYPIDSEGAEILKLYPDMASNKGFVLMIPFSNVDFIRALSTDDKILLMKLVGQPTIFDYGMHNILRTGAMRLSKGIEMILPDYITGLLATVELVGLHEVIKVYNLKSELMKHKSFRKDTYSNRTEFESDLVFHRMLNGCLYEFFSVASNPFEILNNIVYNANTIKDNPCSGFRGLPDAVAAFNHYKEASSEYMAICAAKLMYESSSSFQGLMGEMLGFNNLSHNVDRNNPYAYRFKYLEKINRWYDDYTLEVSLDELEEYNGITWSEIYKSEIFTKTRKLSIKDFLGNITRSFYKNSLILCPRLRIIGEAPKRLHRLVLQKGLEYVDFSGCNFAECESISCLFFGETKLKEVKFPTNGMHNIKDISYLFTECKSLKEVDFVGLWLDNILDATCLFSGCSSISHIKLDGIMCHGFIANSMFSGCSSLNTLDMQTQTARQCSVDGMFAGCKDMVIPKWYDTLENSKMQDFNSDSDFVLVELSELLRNRDAYKNIDKIKVTASQTDMSITNSASLSVSILVRKDKTVNKFSGLFMGYNSSVIDISEVDFSHEKVFNRMFEGCKNLVEIIGSMDCEPRCCENMFMGCTKLQKVDFSKMRFNNCKNISCMFKDCISLEETVYIIPQSLSLNMDAIENSKVKISYQRTDLLRSNFKNFFKNEQSPSIESFEEYFLGYLQCLGYCGKYITKTSADDRTEWVMATKAVNNAARMFELLVYNLCMRIADATDDSTGPQAATIYDCCLYYAGMGLPIQPPSNMSEKYGCKVALANANKESDSNRGYYGKYAVYCMNLDKVFPSVVDINNMMNRIQKICQDAIGYCSIGMNGTSYGSYHAGLLDTPGSLGERPRVVTASENLIKVFAQICTSKAFEISWQSIYNYFVIDDVYSIPQSKSVKSEFISKNEYRQEVIDIVK